MKTVTVIKTGLAVAGLGLVLATNPVAAEERKAVAAPKGHPLDEIISGYEFRNSETKALQNDDFENPGFLWVDTGEELWETADGAAGKACTDCHGDAAETMAKAGAQYPKWDKDSGKAINLEQRINKCRTGGMEADAWKWESDELLSMTTYVRHQSRGEPVSVDVGGPMQAVWQRGKDLYYQRNGQLDMACANCHEDYYGTNIRSDMLSQGQSNGFPTYRLKWQKVGSLHRRFKGCMDQVRATPYQRGSDEFVALETYLAWRGQGLKVETPAVRQ